VEVLQLCVARDALIVFRRTYKCRASMPPVMCTPVARPPPATYNSNICTKKKHQATSWWSHLASCKCPIAAPHLAVDHRPQVSRCYYRTRVISAACLYACRSPEPPLPRHACPCTVAPAGCVVQRCCCVRAAMCRQGVLVVRQQAQAGGRIQPWLQVARDHPVQQHTAKSLGLGEAFGPGPRLRPRRRIALNKTAATPPPPPTASKPRAWGWPGA